MEDPMDYMDKVMRFVGQCGGLEALKKRLMPEGMEWPHYENGKPITFDTIMLSDTDRPFKVDSILFDSHQITFLDYSENISRHIGIHPNVGIEIEEVEIVGNDKEPIRVGQGMYTCVDEADGSCLRIGTFVKVQDIGAQCNFVVVTDEDGEYTWYISPQNLVHKRPVLDNRRNVINKGDVFYSYASRIPRKFVVLELPDADECDDGVFLKCHDMTYDIDCVCNLAYLTRDEPEPDTLQKIECDFTSPFYYYWGCSGYSCENCPHTFIDGHEPTDYFDHDVANCEDAKMLDTIRRIGAFCKELEGKDE